MLINLKIDKVFKFGDNTILDSLEEGVLFTIDLFLENRGERWLSNLTLEYDELIHRIYFELFHEYDKVCSDIDTLLTFLEATISKSMLESMLMSLIRTHVANYLMVVLNIVGYREDIRLKRTLITPFNYDVVIRGAYELE